MVGRTILHYHILEQIGEGGMGAVFRARDRQLDREVALKVLPETAAIDPRARERLLREANTAASLNHPNIAVVHEVGEHDGLLFIVMELVHGRTLASHLAGQAFPLEVAVRHGIHVAEALAHAHERGVIHRDLKASNVMLTEDGMIKVLDFGIARRTAGPGGELARGGTLTEPGAIVGTPECMAPELLRGEEPSVRSDIWSLGVLLYQMLTGRPPFTGNVFETSARVIHQDPPPLPAEVPGPLRGVVMRCLEKDPAQRYRRAAEVRAVLELLAGGHEIPAAAARRRVPRVVFTLAVVSALTALTVLLAMRLRPVPVPRYERLTFQRGLVWTSRFSPDGGNVLYTAAWEGGPPRIYSRSGQVSVPVDTMPARLLAVSSAGELTLLVRPEVHANTFVHRGTLARMFPGNAPRELLEDVADADWVAPGRLAVVRQVAGHWRLEYPPGRELYRSPGFISDLRTSPRKDRLAFIDHPVETDTRGSVVVIDTLGRRHLLADSWDDVGGLAWSRRGDVWFTAARAGGSRSLYTVHAPGHPRLLLAQAGGLTLLDLSPRGEALITRDLGRKHIFALAPTGNREQELAWLDWSIPSDLSRDGRQLLFTEFGEAVGPGYAACLRSTEGGPVVRLGPGRATALSPDERSALSITQGSQPHVTILPIGPGEGRALPRGPLASIEWAEWLPDGRRIVLSGSEPGRPMRCYVQDLQVGPPRAITPEGRKLYTPGAVVSPDGRHIVTTDFLNAPVLYPLAGGAPRPLPGLMARDVVVGWSRDARTLYAYTMGRLPQRIDQIDLATGRRTPGRTVMPLDPSGVTGVGAIVLAQDGASLVYGAVRRLEDLYRVEGLR